MDLIVASITFPTLVVKATPSPASSDACPLYKFTVLCLNDGDSHVPGICTLSFLPLPAAASSAASCEPGTLTIFHQAGVSLPLPLWSPAVFQSHKLPVKIYQCSIINTTKDDHKHNSNLRIPLHLPYLWEDDLISLKQKVKCTDATALKWQKAAKVASSIDFLICITQ